MPTIMAGLAASVASRLEDVIDQFGSSVVLKQAGGATTPATGAFVELATASDHTPFFSSAVLDSLVLPLYTVTLAGAAPTFSGTPITTADFVHMAPPGGSTAVDYAVRSIIYVCLVAGTPIKTLLLVSL